jgi:hypothetical protein
MSPGAASGTDLPIKSFSILLKKPSSISHFIYTKKHCQGFHGLRFLMMYYFLMLHLFVYRRVYLKSTLATEKTTALHALN